MPDAPLHGLRHTHTTLLLEEGIEREVVQKRLGHASIVVTSDIYSHVTRGVFKEVLLKAKTRLVQLRNRVSGVRHKLDTNIYEGIAFHA